MLVGMLDNLSESYREEILASLSEERRERVTKLLTEKD